MIAAYVKKLRHAADVLEELLTSNPFDDPKAARAIGRRAAKNLEEVAAAAEATARRPPWNKGLHLNGAAPAATVAPERHTAKGYKYKPGTHWTQRPENKNKLRRVVRRMSKPNKALAATLKGQS